jgi:hypothetical protein
MKNNNNQNFTDWISGTKEKRSKVAWDELSEEAKQEISKVLELNDSGKSSISALTMLERLSSVYSWDYSEATLVRYCKKVLGRKGWKTK